MFHQQISKEFGENIFNKTKIGLALVSKEGKFLRANEELCRILGYSESELQDKTFAEITDPRDFKGDQSMLDQVILGNIDEYTMLKRYITKNGKIIWVTLIVAGIYEEAEEIAFFFSQIIPEDNIFFQKMQENTKSVKDEQDFLDDDVSSFDVKIVKFIKRDWKYIIFIITATCAFLGDRWISSYESAATLTKVTEASAKNTREIGRLTDLVTNYILKNGKFNDNSIEDSSE